MRDVLALATGEQFALWALRWRRACPWDNRTLAEGHFRALGIAAVEEGIAAFAALWEALSRHGRRRLSLNGCRCRTLAADELAMLTLLAAAQAGEGAHIEALARWLCRPDGQEALVAASRRYARVLASRGLLLPLRGPERTIEDKASFACRRTETREGATR